jgi:hypothetical protein
MFKKSTILLVFIVFCYTLVKAEPIETVSTSNSTVTTTGNSTTTVKSPPPSAIAPMISSINSDICTVAYSGAVQTQVLGISGGAAVRDMNCERLKNAKTLYDMGMKVAAVSIMCQDKRVYDAMEMAGTPCPYDGKIGQEAKQQWEENSEKKPEKIEEDKDFTDTLKGWFYGLLTVGAIALVL